MLDVKNFAAVIARFRIRLAGATFLAAVLVAACGDAKDATVAAPALQEIEADNVIYGLNSYLTSQGVRQGHVRADTAYVYNDSSKLYLRKLEITFYDDAGNERASVTARSGELEQNTDKMVARGDVVLIVKTDGRRIQTQELFYDPTTERIWSDSATVMKEADGTVTRGSSFRSDIEFKNVRVENIRGGANIIF